MFWSIQIFCLGKFTAHFYLPVLSHLCPSDTRSPRFAFFLIVNYDAALLYIP